MTAAYQRPHDLASALALRAGGDWQPLAGATDILPAHVDRPLRRSLLDLSAIDELAGIERTADGWRIGAMVTWRQLIDHDLPPLFDGLKQAAAAIGGWQIQNRATLVGNVCNASPAADGIPNLLALDASIELRSAGGKRWLPLAAFVLGNRRTAIQPDEIVTALVVPDQPAGARSLFLKLGSRRHLVISMSMVAFLVVPATGRRIARAAIAVGACAAVAQRLSSLEQAIAGVPLNDAAARVEDRHLAPLAPIDDIRATAAYRRAATLSLLRRGLTELAGTAV